MKRQTLLLALVAGVSLLGAREAVCEKPQKAPISLRNLQKPKVSVRRSIDNNLIPIVDEIEEILALVGPAGPVLPKPDPGPTFPDPEDDEYLMIEALINILLSDQYGQDFYDYDVPGSASKTPGPEPKGPDGRPFCPEEFLNWQIFEKQGPEMPEEDLVRRRD